MLIFNSIAAPHLHMCLAHSTVPSRISTVATCVDLLKLRKVHENSLRCVAIARLTDTFPEEFNSFLCDAVATFHELVLTG